MTPSVPHLWLRRTRRGFLSRLGGLAALSAVPGLYAGLLTRTPAQTEGPFYPDHLPLDTDNDLLVVNDGLTPAAGVVTWLSGRILGSSGEPIRNALVEIWQADQGGAYLHSGSDNGGSRIDRPVTVVGGQGSSPYNSRLSATGSAPLSGYLNGRVVR